MRTMLRMGTGMGMWHEMVYIQSSCVLSQIKTWMEYVVECAKSCSMAVYFVLLFFKSNLNTDYKALDVLVLSGRLKGQKLLRTMATPTTTTKILHVEKPTEF